jgi:predicted permease
LAESEWERQFESFAFTSVGRLGPGRRLEDAQAEAASVASFLAAEHPQYYGGFYEGRSIVVSSLLDRMVARYRFSILFLFGATVILLVIAVANLTGLLLVRAVNRRHEMAIRSALGAGRGRIFRHLLTETTCLSLLSGGVGFVIAVWAVQILQVLAPTDLARLENLTPDVRVAIFAVATALVSGLLCSCVSLPSTTKAPLASSLRGTGRMGDWKSTARLRGLLVSVQLALALVLLVGAGLLSKSLLKLEEVDPGIQAEGLLVMPIRLPGSYDTVERYTAYFSDVVRQVSSIPGVESASWIPDPPMYGRNMTSPVRTEETGEDEVLPVVGIHPVGPDYFPTMGIPVLNGRGITWADEASSFPVAVVDEVLADQFWPSQNPVGRRVFTRDSWFTVVGVVGRIHQATLEQEAQPAVYVSAFQDSVRLGLIRIVLRSAIPLRHLAQRVRAAVREVDPTIPARTIGTMEDRISADLRSPRFHTFLLSAFSLTAVILTLAGIYGLMLYLVTGRTREIGIRSALGAGVTHVLWTVSRQCLLLISLGLVAGIGIAAITSRLLGALLFAVSPVDPPTFGLVAAGLGLTALLACLMPAWRATRVEPTTALRWE